MTDNRAANLVDIQQPQLQSDHQRALPSVLLLHANQTSKPSLLDDFDYSQNTEAIDPNEILPVTSLDSGEFNGNWYQSDNDDERENQFQGPRRSRGSQRLYRSISRAADDDEYEPQLSLSTKTARLISSFITTSSTHHRGRSIDSSFAPDDRRQSLIPNLQQLRAQYLIGNTKSPFDWLALKASKNQLSRMSSKTRKFYRKQNDLIDRFIEIDFLLDSDLSYNMIQEYETDLISDRRRGTPGNVEEEGQTLLNIDKDGATGIVTLAVIVNFLINVFLLGGKAAIVLLTNSMSVIASLVDSALDFLCTTIIWLSTSMAGASSAQIKRLYPIGRNRLEPIGVLIFSVIIIVSFFEVAIEAIERISNGPRVPVQLGLPSFAIMSLAVITKLFAWLWCRSIDSSAVQALAQDAMSDIVFNLMSILFPVVGSYLNIWWLDPTGALLLSVYIIVQWVDTTLEHIRNLTGIAGDDEDKQVIMYLCVRFAESIKQVTSINVYHAGDQLHVEVDIVVDEKLKLRDSHDLGEALQYAIESLPMVERAFVHLDYRDDNFIGHIMR
ncbi:cation efflux family-domain-containing protein [Lipomyces japonicus]|uniref:cation efflux family-domain-containing protein n=1 Tax=Lipomyces japonicus TaxID=56871 RepID=UPI0034CDE321